MPAPTTPDGELPKTDGRAVRVLILFGEWVETHGFIAFSVLAITYLCVVLGYSLVTPLWHDELFTFHIAQAASIPELFREIRTVDLNPPLSYLLTRASFRLFGVGTLPCRLPEMLGFLLAMLGVFLYVRRRAGQAYACLAVALLLCSDAVELSMQARPYGLMLGFTALAFASWQAACEAPSRTRRAVWAELALFGSTTALLLTHVFGLLAWASLVAGESALAFQTRRIQVSRAAALVLPLGAATLYLPLLQNHGASAFPPAFQPNTRILLAFYTTYAGRPFLCILSGIAAVVLMRRKRWLRGEGRYGLTVPEWVATLGLLALPAILMAHLRLNHGAFFDRYGVVASLGTSVLAAVFLSWWAGTRAGVAVLAAVLSLQISGRLPDLVRTVKQRQIFRSAEPFVPGSNMESFMNPGLPLVDASGLTFVEMNDRASRELLSRTFYLDDPAAALAYSHATIFNGMELEAKLFHFAGHVEPYSQFVAVHPRFYVLGTYGYPEDWLLRKLQADGAQLRLLGPIYAYYKDQELYEVSMPPATTKP